MEIWNEESNRIDPAQSHRSIAWRQGSSRVEGGSVVARMSIDDMLGRDPRLLRLAKLCGLSKYEVAGRLVLDVWPLCYDRERAELPIVDVDIAAGIDGFAEMMIEVGLAVAFREHKVRINGARDRIRYLQAKREAGYKGGVKSGESRNKKGKQNSSKPEAQGKQTRSKHQAAGNPPAPDPSSASSPDPVPDPVPALVLDHPGIEPEGSLGFRDVVACFDGLYRKRSGGSAPTWGKKQGGMLNELLAKHSAAEVISRIKILFTAPPRFLSGSVPDLGTLVQHFDKLAAPSQQTTVHKSPTQIALEELERIESEES